MAENKKSFLIYCDLIHTVKKMNKSDAGELFLHLLEYVNDLNPTTENMVVELVFEPIKQQLKRDLVVWEKKEEERSLNGRIGNLKRWNNDLFLRFETGEISIIEAESIAKNRKASPPDQTVSPHIAKVAVTVNGTGTVTGTVNDTTIKESIIDRKLKFSHSLEIYLSEYGRDLLNDFYSYWTEHGEKDKKMRFEKQTSFDIKRRLTTWKNNNEKFKKNGKSGFTTPQPKQKFRGAFAKAVNNYGQTEAVNTQGESFEDTEYTELNGN